MEEENKKKLREWPFQYYSILITTQYMLQFSIIIFGRHTGLVGDIVVDINKEEVYQNKYIREIRQSLQTAYLKCKEAIIKSNNKYKVYYEKI